MIRRGSNAYRGKYIDNRSVELLLLFLLILLDNVLVFRGAPRCSCRGGSAVAAALRTRQGGLCKQVVMLIGRTTASVVGKVSRAGSGGGNL